MADPPFKTTEELPTASIQVGAASVFAEQKEHEKDGNQQEDQNPTVEPTDQNQADTHGEKKPTGRQLKHVTQMFELLLQEEEEEAEVKKLAASSESVKNSEDNDVTTDILESTEIVKAYDQSQVGAARKEKNRKGKKEDKKGKKKGHKEDEVKKRKGQINSAKKYVERVNTNYPEFLDGANQLELQKIADILNASDENTWDNAVSASILARIESVNLEAKKRFNQDKMTSKRIVQLNESLDHEAQRSTAEAQRSTAEAQRRLLEADTIDKLVSKFKLSVKKLEYQRSLVPTEEIAKKEAMSKTLLFWLEQKLERLKELLGYKDLVEDIEAWNNELLDKTFWDHSTENKEKSTSGRQAVQDYENTKFERLIFNPTRTSFLHFIQYMTDRLCDHPQYGYIESKVGQFDKILRVPLLGHQKASKQPPWWLILELQDEAARATMHIRSDNLYIGGFGNKNDQVYELLNKDNSPLIKGAIPFNCGCDYTALMNFERIDYSKTDSKPPPDQDVVRLKKLILNMAAQRRDIKAMSEYDHRLEETLTPQKWMEIVKAVQIAIARTAVTFPEVCRFVAIFASVDQGWLSEFGSYLNDQLIAYMRNWKVISYAIRNDLEGGESSFTERKGLGMTHAFEGFEILRLALNTKGEGLLKEEKSNGDGPKKQPPPPPGNDKESKDDGGKGKGSENESGNAKESKDHDSRGGAITPLGTKYEGVDSQGDCQLCGQVLMEIFSVHTNTNSVKGISVYDGRCGKVIYKSSHMDSDNFLKKRDSWLSTHTEMDSCDYMEELLITGPDRVISALPGYVIEVDVGDEKEVFDFWWHWSDRTAINKPMTQSVFTSQGEVHITSAVFSDAVQASMEFLYFLPPNSLQKKLEVQGNLVLQIEHFPIGTNIFQNDVEGGVYMTKKNSFHMTAKEETMIIKETYATKHTSRKYSGCCMKLPLNRDVFALPIGCRLHVTGTLVLKNSKGVTLVSIDDSFEWKDQLTLCKLSPSGVSGYLMGSHAAMLIKATSPF